MRCWGAIIYLLKNATDDRWGKVYLIDSVQARHMRVEVDEEGEERLTSDGILSFIVPARTPSFIDKRDTYASTEI